MKHLKINIVSDVMCPWCIIGYQNLAKALVDLKDEVTADIQWHPFELNPDMPIEGQEIQEHLQEKYGLTPEQALENRQRIEMLGKESGFTFNFADKRLMINSFDCHRLLTWAQIEGKQTELKLALFKAHFSDQIYLNDQAELLKIVAQVGLDQDRAKAILTSDEFATSVKDEEASMQRMGISSVPTFIINDKYAISGGQASDTFKQALKQISDEE
ncbi:DsbA family oxidoreductase [Marinomonas agarivorans]|nr:DsbA family oxidoreductase [Marinomonas agarivorans]